MAITQVKYQEPSSSDITLEAEDGDEGGLVPIHDVRNATSITTAVGAVTTAVGTNTTAVNAVTTAVGDVETAVGAVETAVDTVAANQAPPSAFYAGSKTIASTATPEAIAGSQALIEGVWIQAAVGNTSTCFVGPSGSELFPLAVGDPPLFIRIDNLNKVYVDVGTNGDIVKYVGW
jgi:hypothetical protein